MFCGGYNRTTFSRVIIRLDISCKCLPYSANMTLTIDSKRRRRGGGGRRGRWGVLNINWSVYKPLFLFSQNVLLLFLLFNENIYSGYTLEAALCCASNEYPLHTFLWTMTKMIIK